MNRKSGISTKKPSNEISKLNISTKLTDSNLTHTSKSIQTACCRDVDNNVQSNLAYVTLMTNEREKARVIALSCALKAWSTLDVDYVVMVTQDISSRSRSTLLRYYNNVVEVESLSGKRTKFHALGLLNYKKVLYVSNNMLVLGRGMDRLFEMFPPAATVTVFKDTEQDYWHGRLCQADNIELSMKFAQGVKTSLMLLRPNKTDHLRLVQSSSSMVGKTLNQQTLSSKDSTHITEFYKSQWSHIHNKFTFYPWLNTLNYTPACFDMRECDPEYLNQLDHHGHQFEIVLTKWHNMVRKMSKNDSYLKKLFEKYDWFHQGSGFIK